MFIDIMVPFWGDPALLYQAVDSVLAQTADGWRLTIVDDCYPDASVAEHFATLTDPRIRYLRNPENLGIIANFQHCKDLAEADYVVFMGCDDLMCPGYVAEIKKMADRFPGAEIVQPGVRVIDEQGRTHLPLSDRVKAVLRPSVPGAAVLSGERLAASLLVGDWLYWPSLAFRTAAVQQVDFEPDRQIILDLGLVLDMVRRGARLVLAPEIVFEYRRHSSSLSSTALLDGSRFAEEKSFFVAQSRIFSRLGWRRAARAARVHLTSRLHAASLLPAAARSSRQLRTLVRHALG